MGKYIVQAHLENALSTNTVLQLFDDGTGNVNTAAVAAVIDRAEAMFESYVFATNKQPLANPADRLVVHACLEFACVFSFERHPEYVRTFGEEPRVIARYARAVELAERVANSTQRLPDQNGGSGAVPANVGADVFSAVPTSFTTLPEGQYDRGDF